MGTSVDLLCFLFIAFTLLFVICHSEDFVDTTYSHLLAELPYAIIFSSVVFIFLQHGDCFYINYIFFINNLKFFVTLEQFSTFSYFRLKVAQHVGVLILILLGSVIQHGVQLRCRFRYILRTMHFFHYCRVPNNWRGGLWQK